MTDLAERRAYDLADRYRLDEGRAFASGVQAAARIPVEQLRADRRAGLNTAAFVSGYPGSPLAGYDREVAAASRAQPDLPVVLRPGLNEELAATAVMGSQLTASLGDCRYDGVLGIWYGKSPGLDRASDALRHAVFAGSSPLGGAVALVGDDPAAKSSTLPSSSDATLVSLHMPILFPGDVQDVIDLGRHAVHLSRASGLWTSVKLVSQVADGTGTVEIHADRIRPIVPVVEVDGRPFVPHPSGRLLTPYTLDMEREFVEVRSELARRYGVENDLNRVTVDSPHAWIGIAASGHTYNETVEALRILGLRTDDDVRAAGIRLFQLRMPVPVDTAQLRQVARGLDEVVVIEEKNPTLELLVKDALYASPDRPVVVGKRDDRGEPLVPGSGTLDANLIAAVLRRRLVSRLGDDRLAPPAPEVRQRRSLIPLTVNRTPFFCSGCPHNVSTEVPEGTLLGGGIGCHSMVLFMDTDRVGELAGLTAMGNEGAQWIGMEPFIERDHLVQNLGDGTFFHSGMLAVRAAVAAGSHITYKLLYNGTVAMTGGQDPEGGLDVPTVVTVLLAEGVSEVLITTDDPAKYDDVSIPSSVRVWHRSRIVEAQERLRDVPGVTVLVHDQMCAAEKRRDRKRGRAASPGFKVLIDERVCEGCGDCGETSNCLSVQPHDTPWGRKTRIDQTSCNLDLSCMDGDCPSFAEVRPARGRRSRRPERAGVDRTDVSVDDLGDPDLVVGRDCAIRMTGIGGTGVVTVSQVIGTAAMLDGLHVRGLDQTGLSQKAGPVVSDLRLSAEEPTASNRASLGAVDCALAFDLLVASGDNHLTGVSPERTVVIGSTSATPTGTMVRHPDQAYPSVETLTSRLDASSREDVNRYADAAGITTGLFGDATTANVFLLGVAVQAGAVPVRPGSIEAAIELNGVAVAKNRAAFRWGRRWVVDPLGVETASGIARGASPAVETETVDDLVQRCEDDLVDYQGVSLARRFRAVVDAARAAESALDPFDDDLPFTVAVATNLHKLMAYKDEYEVARLLVRPEAIEAAEAIGGPGARVRWRLHPPALRSLGLTRKIALGPWARPLLVALRAGRRVRGSLLDPFRWAQVRRVERAMVGEYVDAVETLIDGLDSARLVDAIEIASLPDRVRGYEHLKLERAGDYRAALAARLASWSSGSRQSTAR